MEPKYINTDEASRLYGIPKKTLENWRSQKRGPRYHKSGKRVVYRVADLEAFMAGHSIHYRSTPCSVRWMSARCSRWRSGMRCAYRWVISTFL